MNAFIRVVTALSLLLFACEQARDAGTGGASGIAGAAAGAMSPDAPTAGVSGGTGGGGSSAGDVVGPTERAGSSSGATEGTGVLEKVFTDAELVEQGCVLGREAFAYRAGVKSEALTGEAASLVPCWSPTGFGSSEVSLGIARDGTVYLAPAYTPEGNGIAISDDHGATWKTSIPTFPEGTARTGHGRAQPVMLLEPNSERILFTSSVMQAINPVDFGYDMSISADGGATWTYSFVFDIARDWLKLYAGPTVTSPLGDFPAAIYASVPVPITTQSFGIVADPDYQSIHQSLDGGETWTQVGSESLTLKASLAASTGIATAEVCPANEYIIFGNGVVDSDGTIFMGYRLCRTLAVAVSEDEGKTWTTHAIPGATLPVYDFLTSYLVTNNIIPSEPLALDAEGNLYAVWNDAEGLLCYAVSTDRGAGWTKPVTVSAPDVVTTVLSSIAVRKPGTVALSYFGSTDGLAFNGYIAETTNALDAAPVFTSAIVNDTDEPLFPNGFDNNYGAVLFGGDLDEFIQVKYAPNGDIWSSFIQEMCVNLNTAACTWDYAAHANSVFQGATGRIVHRRE